MKELEELGRQHGAVNYDATPTIQIIHYLSLIKEYEKKCAILGFSYLDKLLINTDYTSTQTKTFFKFANSLSKDILDCIKKGDKLIAIPLGIRFEKSKTGHANMLIYRPDEKTIERFEPHGQQYKYGADNKDYSINEILKTMFEEKMKPYLKNYTPKYIPPYEICPSIKGFQALESGLAGLDKEGGGFCGMWSNFTLEIMFLNQELTTKEVIQKALDISKEDPQYLKNVIRGYVLKVEKVMDKLIKTIDANEGFTFEKDAEDLWKKRYKDIEIYIVNYLKILGGKSSHIEIINKKKQEQLNISRLRGKYKKLYTELFKYKAEELETLIKKVFKYDTEKDTKMTENNKSYYTITFILDRVEKNNKKENEIYEYIKKLEKNKI
jgi:hypothetical protein